MAQTKLGAAKVVAKKAGVSLDDYIKITASGQKWCYKCTVFRPLENFNSDKSRSDGKSSLCHSCVRIPVEQHKSHKGRVSTFKGRKHSPEAIQKQKDAWAKRKASGYVSPKKGRPRTAAERKAISESVRKTAHKFRGSNHYNWQGGKTSEHSTIRKSFAYADWRKAVFARDNYTCQKCGDNRGGNLNAHHIKPFATHPDLRLDVSNGVTLCEDCHQLEH